MVSIASFAQLVRCFLGCWTVDASWSWLSAIVEGSLVHPRIPRLSLPRWVFFVGRCSGSCRRAVMAPHHGAEDKERRVSQSRVSQVDLALVFRQLLARGTEYDDRAITHTICCQVCRRSLRFFAFSDLEAELVMQRQTRSNFVSLPAVVSFDRPHHRGFFLPPSPPRKLHTLAPPGALRHALHRPLAANLDLAVSSSRN